MLKEHRDGLKELAELLLQREVVFTEDVERIFGKRKKDIERERREAAAKAGAEGASSEASAPSADEKRSGTQNAAVSAAGTPEQAGVKNPSGPESVSSSDSKQKA